MWFNAVSPQDVEKNSQTTETVSHAASDIANLKKEVSSLDSKIKQKDNDIAELYEEQKGQTLALRKELEVKQKNLAPLNDKYNDAEANYKLTEGKLRIIRERLGQSSRDIQEARDALDACSSSLIDKVSTWRMCVNR